MATPSLAAPEVAKRLAGPNPPLLLDVREPWEFASASIPGAILMPLGQLQARFGELEPARDRDMVVYCHHGVRSLHACMFLAGQGFGGVANLSGGIEAWSIEVDPTTPRY